LEGSVNMDMNKELTLLGGLSACGISRISKITPTNENNIEGFIKKLSIETAVSYDECKSLVEMINCRVGNIETAKRIYEKDGVYALIIYANQVKLGAIY
jgi:hypothetical protein